MGQEIGRISFSPADFARFDSRLREETALLQAWYQAGRFDQAAYMGGFELEAWLLDHNFFPLPRNAEYLERLGNPLVVPELSRFNVEVNGTPQPLSGQALRRLEEELTGTWRHCMRVVHELQGQLIMIGILPTIRQSDLTLTNISAVNRYYALNDEGEGAEAEVRRTVPELLAHGRPRPPHALDLPALPPADHLASSLLT